MACRPRRFLPDDAYNVVCAKFKLSPTKLLKDLWTQSVRLRHATVSEDSASLSHTRTGLSWYDCILRFGHDRMNQDVWKLVARHSRLLYRVDIKMENQVPLISSRAKRVAVHCISGSRSDDISSVKPLPVSGWKTI